MSKENNSENTITALRIQRQRPKPQTNNVPTCFTCQKSFDCQSKNSNYSVNNSPTSKQYNSNLPSKNICTLTSTFATCVIEYKIKKKAHFIKNFENENEISIFNSAPFPTEMVYLSIVDPQLTLLLTRNLNLLVLITILI